MIELPFFISGTAAVEIRLDGAIERLVAELFESVDVLLKCGVVNEDVEFPQLADGPLHRGLAKIRVGNVS